MEKNSIPFPQADDFEKIINILTLCDEEKLNNKFHVSSALGNISDRQVQYYINAARYLNLISAEKTFTSKGKYIRSLNSEEQIIELVKLLLKDNVFSTVYLTEKHFEFQLSRDEVIEIMKNNDIYFESEELYKRRAQTVISWVSWIKKSMNDN